MQPKLPDITAKNNSVCPFLGVSDDPGTALSFLSASNYCHHAKPISPIRRAHQARFCLGDSYEKCQVFKTQGSQPLPPEIGEPKYSVHPNLRRVLLLSSLFVILAAAIIVLDVTGTSSTNSKQIEQEINFQALQTITQMAQLTQMGIVQTPEPSLTPEPSPTVAEITPTPFPTGFVPHQLEVPFGSNPKFVIHKVQAGENFMRFMQNYNTSKAAIVAVNFGFDSILWADSILIIPIDITDATGLPAFTTFQVAEPNMTANKIAADQGADLGLLVKYNDLPAGYVFSVGEWVLIPQ